ncbi:MAG: hypothetical protein CR217_08805 [Beijerinckiaceae bacterium]|nr:MAG: hypothetical protein CR217_08805 [Beijerinckiaceae bacterium]
MIDTATNTVVTTVPLGVTNTISPIELAVAPDGKHVYVLPGFKVLAIDAATNIVVARISVKETTFGLAVTPDGTHAYVANQNSNNVSVIATATNTVVATVPVGITPEGVAITPDGKHAYVGNRFNATVSVIRTRDNTVVATVPVAGSSSGVAVTPDGKHAYVAIAALLGGFIDASVSVIRTATNTVVATVPCCVGLGWVGGVGIVPPPPGVRFLAFSATALDIAFGTAPNEDFFNLHSQFTLSSTAPGLHPIAIRSRSRSAPSPLLSRPTPSRSSRTALSPSRG